MRNHEGVLGPLLAFAACGAIGQLFIFETLEHFGSLTLVYASHSLQVSSFTDYAMYRTVTLTRKLFTMLLSVVVYRHTLASGQWAGAAIVFAGIALEAWVKRRGACIPILVGYLRNEELTVPVYRCARE